MNPLLRWVVVGSFVCGGLARLAAVETPKTTKDVESAMMWLTSQGRLEEALEVGANWLNAHPQDARVLYADGWARLMKSTIEPDAGAATALRKRAYAETDQARKLGCNEPLMVFVFRSTDAEGRNFRDSRSFSTVPAAAAAMERGEQAFTHHDLATALACYQQALAIDPHAYAAALFIGDVYFNQNKQADAIVWFGKAIAIDPDTETAHRYLADAYARVQKPTEARAEYIEAVIAQPYDRIPREMLGRFAQRTGHPLQAPKVSPPRANISLADGKVQVGVDPNGGALALAYAVGRAGWYEKERGKYFPKSAKSRHSLYEECAGLRLLIGTASELPKDGLDEPSKKLLPSIAVLKKIDDAGLLECYVLLDDADQEIAADYAAYRALHRDLLRRYITEVWFGEDRAPGRERANGLPPH